MRHPMPLEELGLLCLLERVEAPDGRLDGFARYGLMQRGLVKDDGGPVLTQEGAVRLAELRQWRAELSDEAPSVLSSDAIPTPA